MAFRVLIVDDQKDVSRLLRSALETIEQGLEVVEAPSGEEAILEATRNKVDLLISDFRLPGITGVELMKKFRLRNPDVKVILITGVSDTKSIKEINDSKADAYFAKPVPMGDFLDAVERTLGLTRTIVKPDTGQLVAKEEPKTNTLADTLVTLRKDLKANVVLLLDAAGHVEAIAGELPDQNNSAGLISSLMSIQNAAQKTASLLDGNMKPLHLFSGEKTDALFLPMGTTHGLFIIGKSLAEHKSLAATMERLSKTRAEVMVSLQKSGVVEQAKPAEGTRVSEEPYTQPENLSGEFMQIFDQVGKKKDDANSFWDTAVEKGTTFAEPDKLTYDQASRLGLTPDSDDKKE